MALSTFSRSQSKNVTGRNYTWNKSNCDEHSFLRNMFGRQTKSRKMFKWKFALPRAATRSHALKSCIKNRTTDWVKFTTNTWFSGPKRAWRHTHMQAKSRQFACTVGEWVFGEKPVEKQYCALTYGRQKQNRKPPKGQIVLFDALLFAREKSFSTRLGSHIFTCDSVYKWKNMKFGDGGSGGDGIFAIPRHSIIDYIID